MQPQENSEHNKEKKFAIVSFPDEEEQLFIVPSQWLLQDDSSQYSCLWPPYISVDKIKSSVLKNENPQLTWRSCNANLVIKCKTYEFAESIRSSILKISARRSILLHHQLQESKSSSVARIENNLESSAVTDSSLLLFEKTVKELNNIKISNEVPKTTFAESSKYTSNPQILKASIACQTEKIKTPSRIIKTPSKNFKTASNFCTSEGKIYSCTSEGKIDSCASEGKIDSCTSECKIDSCTSEGKIDSCASEGKIDSCTSECKIDSCTSEGKIDSCISEAVAILKENSSFMENLSKYLKEIDPLPKSNASAGGNRRINCLKDYHAKFSKELNVENSTLDTAIKFSEKTESFPIDNKPAISFDEAFYKPTFDAYRTGNSPFETQLSWTAIKFKPPTETEVVMKGSECTYVGTRHQCITGMKEYENKSFEELRMADLCLKIPGINGFTFTQCETPQSTPDSTDSSTNVFAARWIADKFQPPTETKVSMLGKELSFIGTRIQCITCMKEYEDKSLEELRLEELTNGTYTQQSLNHIKAQFPNFCYNNNNNNRRTAGPNIRKYKPLLFGVSDATGASSTTEAYPAVKFQPVCGKDRIQTKWIQTDVNTLLQCITCMKEYEDKSFEELHLEFSVAMHKEQSPVGNTVHSNSRTMAMPVYHFGTNCKQLFDTTNANCFSTSIK